MKKIAITLGLGALMISCTNSDKVDRCTVYLNLEFNFLEIST